MENIVLILHLIQCLTVNFLINFFSKIFNYLMYCNQADLHKVIPRTMLINLIGSNYLHESITSICLDITEGEYTGRLRATSLLNVDQLFNKNKAKTKSGLLNLDWLRKTIYTRAATIILIYDTKSKPENMSWKDYENSIHLDISKVKKIDNYSFTNLVVLIYSNSNSFSFDIVNDDKERIYNIKKILDPKNLIYINGTEGLKNNSKKLQNHILKMTVNYYRTIKKNYKNKKATSLNELKEKTIKYNIKLGVLSQLKNKKLNSKYFEEAYKLLNSIDAKNYAFGVYNNIRNNFFELKTVAEWLYVKIHQIKSAESKKNTNTLITLFNGHMQTYSSGNELINKTDKMNVVEYIWRILRYEYFAKFLEENVTDYHSHYLNFPGYYRMLASFNIARLLQFINQIGMDQLLLTTDKSYMNIIMNTNLQIRENKYFGKAPTFYIQIDPLTEKTFEEDENLYIRYMIQQNNISTDTLYAKLNDNINIAQKLYNSLYNLNMGSTMVIYLNILTVLSNEELKNNSDKLKYYYKAFMNSKDIHKFPSIFLKYLENYNNILLNDNEIDNGSVILNNIISIGSIRHLNLNEETILLKLLFEKNISKEIKQKFVLEKNNKILNFSYSLSNNTPNIFDVIEYNLIFSTTLTKASIKFKTISLIFNNNDRNKTYFEGPYEVSSESNLTLSYKLFIKENDRNLKLKSLRCELLTDNGNVIYFEVNNKTEIDKVITIRNTETNVLKIEHLKNIKIGSNQYYNFECEIMKIRDDIDIDNLNLRFVLQDNEQPNISKSFIADKSKNIF